MTTRIDSFVAGRWAALIVFAVSLAIYVPTAHARSIDVLSADLAAWQLASTGDTTYVVASLPQLNEREDKAIWLVPNAKGEPTIGRAAGLIAASVPSYILAGGEDFGPGPARVTAATLTALTVTLFFLLVQRRLPGASALASTGALALATPLWSVAADGMWPHTLTSLGIIGMAWAAQRDRWWAVGAFGGIALLGRLHSAIICAALGLGLALVRRDPLIAVKTGLSSGLILAANSLWNLWFYGSWSPTAAYRSSWFVDYAETNRFDILNLTGFLLAPDRGIFVWTPIVLLLLLALKRSWRSLPDWSRILFLAGLVYLVAQAVLNRYSGGSAFFPYRLGIEPLVCAAPAFAFSVAALKPSERRFVPHVLLLQFALIGAGAVGLVLMPEVGPGRNELLAQSITVASLVAFWTMILLLGRALTARTAEGPATT